MGEILRVETIFAKKLLHISAASLSFEITVSITISGSQQFTFLTILSPTVNSLFSIIDVTNVI